MSEYCKVLVCTVDQEIEDVMRKYQVNVNYSSFIELPNVIEKKRVIVETGFFGREIGRKTVVDGYLPQAIICEETDNELIDVITGVRFPKIGRYSSNNNVSSRIRLMKSCFVSSDAVVDMLKKLTRDDVLRYKKSMGDFFADYSIGYRNYLRKEQHLKNNDDYIKKFKNRY